MRSVIIAVVIAALSDVVRRLITPKATIAWGVSHQHFFTIPNGSTAINVRTKQIFVQNIGRASAEDVEIVLNYKPEHFDIWPPGIASAEEKGRFMVLTAKNLNSKEFFSIDIINQVTEIPAIVGARWKGGIAKERLMGPMQIYSRWILILFGSICVLGELSVIFTYV